jgi:hypothetical protein
MASITKRPSRHLLPMPSVIFKSKLNLHATNNLHNIDEDAPDEGLSALPAFPAADERPKKMGLWRRFVNKIIGIGKKQETEMVIGVPTDFRRVGSRSGSGEESKWEDEEEE